MTVLKERAKAFEKLFNIQYKIILGRQGKTVEFILSFEKEHFFHLIGLHKLKDISYPTKNRERLFNIILNEGITYEMVKKSDFFLSNKEKKYPGIEERINSLIKLEEILDSNYLTFKYNKHRMRWCDIKFKYVFESVDCEIPIYIFIDEISNNGNMGCVSMFPKFINDYTNGQTTMALLYKEKINLKTGESVVQLNKLKNKEEKEVATTSTEKENNK